MQQVSTFEQLQIKIDAYKIREVELVEKIKLFEWYQNSLEIDARKHSRLLSAVREELEIAKSKIVKIQDKINNCETAQMLIDDEERSSICWERENGTGFANFIENKSAEEQKMHWADLDNVRRNVAVSGDDIVNMVLGQREEYGSGVNLMNKIGVIDDDESDDN